MTYCPVADSTVWLVWLFLSKSSVDILSTPIKLFTFGGSILIFSLLLTSTGAVTFDPPPTAVIFSPTGWETLLVLLWFTTDGAFPTLFYTLPWPGYFSLSLSLYLPKNYKYFIVVSWPANLFWGFEGLRKSYTKQLPYMPPATKVWPFECSPTQLNGSSAAIFLTDLT